MEGSIQKSADAVRVNVQLIKAATDSHLWADTFDRKLTDIFAVESEIAATIADKLRAKLTDPEAAGAESSTDGKRRRARTLFEGPLFTWNKRNTAEISRKRSTISTRQWPRILTMRSPRTGIAQTLYPLASLRRSVAG